MHCMRRGFLSVVGLSTSVSYEVELKAEDKGLFALRGIWEDQQVVLESRGAKMGLPTRPTL